MVPALNAMIDITATRWYMTIHKVPEPVLVLLFILICICSFYLGYSISGKKMDWIGVIVISLVVCMVVHLIIDIDRPRRGLITAQQTSQALVDLRAMFAE